MPAFLVFIRDAMQFPDMVHSLKPSPKTNLQDPNRFFDFFAAEPEAIAAEFCEVVVRGRQGALGG